MRCFSSILAISIFTFALVPSPTTARPHSVWDVNIFTGPAPPPDQGPPASAGALRDKSKLKYEISGIAGAYAVWLLLTLFLLLFVGKRLRRKTQTSNRTLSMEILKPAPGSNQLTISVEPPLKSPGKLASLRSWAESAKPHGRKQSNVSLSTTIDEKILEADKVRNMDEMTKLYAAVMVHDGERSQKARSGGQTSPRTPQFATQHTAPPMPRSPFYAPPTPRSPYHQSQLKGPSSPRSPRYPPEFQHLRNAASEDGPDHGIQPASRTLIHPLAPTPADEQSTLRMTPQSRTRKTKVSPLSIVSGRNELEDQAVRRTGQISVRGQPISSPLPSATLTEVSTYSEDAGAPSPRIYHPGPPPPTPGQKSFMASTVDVNRRGPPAALSLRITAPSNSSSNTLPFRQFYNKSLLSAPPTKRTFVDRRESMMGVHPKTGVPQTPYSPYMPHTPMTPMTPRSLMTKKEMKRNRKKEGLKVLSEDDVVLSDEDMWGEMK